MDEQRIQEIKARLQATTPGTWKVREPDEDYFGSEDPTIETESGQYIAQTSYDEMSGTTRETMYADAEFIAHAKEDIAYLLDVYSKYKEALIQQLKAAIKIVEEACKDCYICEGLDIAEEIVKAGLDADITETVQKHLDTSGI